MGGLRGMLRVSIVPRCFREAKHQTTTTCFCLRATLEIHHDLPFLAFTRILTYMFPALAH